MLYSGTDTAKDLAWARYWYERAAEQHHPRAQNNLGWMCENGEGGVIDLSRAIAWYKRSASQANPDGLFNLGQALEQGKGVAKDVVQALALYRKSAALANKAAAAAIKRLTGKDAAATSSAEERVDSISDN